MNKIRYYSFYVDIKEDEIRIFKNKSQKKVHLNKNKSLKIFNDIKSMYRDLIDPEESYSYIEFFSEEYYIEMDDSLTLRLSSVKPESIALLSNNNLSKNKFMSGQKVLEIMSKIFDSIWE